MLTRSIAVVAALLALTSGLAARAGDPEFVPGASQIEFDERPVDLVLPDDFDHEKQYSLVVVIDGSLDELSKLEKDRTIFCTPHKKRPGLWAGNAVGAIHDLVKYLQKHLPIPDHRLHVIGFGQGLNDILTMVAFSKKSPFISATYVSSLITSGSIAGRAKKKMGAISFGDQTDDPAAKGIVEALDGKVRSAEARPDRAGTDSEYYRYWLRVMEGECTPGHDLSFAWSKDTQDAAGYEKAKSRATSAGLASFVYFYGEDDDTKPEAKTLQNVVFLQHTVRAAAADVVPIKLDRAAHAELFTALGLKTTPAIVVLDHAGEVASKLEGKIKATTFAKALRAAAKKAKKAR